MRTQTWVVVALFLITTAWALQSRVAAQIPLPTAATSSASAPVLDQKAVTLLNAVQAKLQRIRTIRAVYTEIVHSPPSELHSGSREHRHIVDVRFMRPNFARVDYSIQLMSKSNLVWSKNSVSVEMASDGRAGWRYFPGSEEYTKTAVGRSTDLYHYQPELLCGFFDPKTSLLRNMLEETDYKLTSVRYSGKRIWSHAPCQVIVCTWESANDSFANGHAQNGKEEITECLFIGSDDLIHRESNQYSTGSSDETDLDFVEVNAPMSKQSFAYTLPVGAHPVTPTPPLLANGVPAPNFSVTAPDGKLVRLSDFSGKVVVLDFWATWCSPCQQSLPPTNALAEKLKDKNVEFLAVNVWDTVDAYTAWLPTHKQLGSLQFAIDTAPAGADIATKLYMVTGIPTQYVIDPAGKVAATFVGYDGDNQATALEAAIDKALGN